MEVISNTAGLLRSASFVESVEVNLPFVVRVGGHHEPPRFDRQQVVLSHHPCNPLVVDDHAASLKLGSYSPIPVATTMFEDHRLDGRSDLHVLVDRRLFFQ